MMSRHDIVREYRRTTFEKFDAMPIDGVISKLPNHVRLSEGEVITTVYRRSLMFRFVVEYLKSKGIYVKINHLVGTRNCYRGQ